MAYSIFLRLFRSTTVIRHCMCLYWLTIQLLLYWQTSAWHLKFIIKSLFIILAPSGPLDKLPNILFNTLSNLNYSLAEYFIVYSEIAFIFPVCPANYHFESSKIFNQKSMSGNYFPSCQRWFFNVDSETTCDNTVFWFPCLLFLGIWQTWFKAVCSLASTQDTQTEIHCLLLDSTVVFWDHT